MIQLDQDQWSGVDSSSLALSDLVVASWCHECVSPAASNLLDDPHDKWVPRCLSVRSPELLACPFVCFWWHWLVLTWVLGETATLSWSIPGFEPFSMPSFVSSPRALYLLLRGTFSLVLHVSVVCLLQFGSWLSFFSLQGLKTGLLTCLCHWTIYISFSPVPTWWLSHAAWQLPPMTSLSSLRPLGNCQILKLKFWAALLLLGRSVWVRVLEGKWL